jgi:hypothetical protein
MLKFANLSLSQKKCVVVLIEANPTLAKVGRITLKEVVTITQDLASKRTNGAPKIGYPNWLFKSNKIERGVYQLPVPSEKELSDYTQNSVKARRHSPLAPKVKAPKVKKVTAARVAKTSNPVAGDSASRLQSIIEESVAHDPDEEDFNQVLRDNGIEV